MNLSQRVFPPRLGVPLCFLPRSSPQRVELYLLNQGCCNVGKKQAKGRKQNRSSRRRDEAIPFQSPKGLSRSIPPRFTPVNLPNDALLFDAITAWASLRREGLQRLFARRRASIPPFSTWSRLLGQAVDPVEWERGPGAFCSRDLPSAAHPGQRHRCRDGKTLKGTIPLGATPGVPRLAASLPQEGVGLAHVQVTTVGNEVRAAAVLRASIDRRGTVVSGDTTGAARQLSTTILQAMTSGSSRRFTA